MTSFGESCHKHGFPYLLIKIKFCKVKKLVKAKEEAMIFPGCYTCICSKLGTQYCAQNSLSVPQDRPEASWPLLTLLEVMRPPNMTPP